MSGPPLSGPFGLTLSRTGDGIAQCSGFGGSHRCFFKPNLMFEYDPPAVADVRGRSIVAAGKGTAVGEDVGDNPKPALVHSASYTLRGVRRASGAMRRG